MRIIAADPGSRGAIAVGDVSADGIRNITIYDMPRDHLDNETMKSGDPKLQVDEMQIFAIAEAEKPDFAIIEKNQYRPTDGGLGTFTHGRGFGALRASLRCYFHASGKPPGLILVTPTVWKQFFGLSDKKGESLAMARELFPELGEQLKLKKHDGRAEALLLLVYYQRELMKLNSIEVI